MADAPDHVNLALVESEQFRSRLHPNVVQLASKLAPSAPDTSGISVLHVNILTNTCVRDKSLRGYTLTLDPNSKIPRNGGWLDEHYASVVGMYKINAPESHVIKLLKSLKTTLGTLVQASPDSSPFDSQLLLDVCDSQQCLSEWIPSLNGASESSTGIYARQLGGLDQGIEYRLVVRTGMRAAMRHALAHHRKTTVADFYGSDFNNHVRLYSRINNRRLAFAISKAAGLQCERLYVDGAHHERYEDACSPISLHHYNVLEAHDVVRDDYAVEYVYYNGCYDATNDDVDNILMEKAPTSGFFLLTRRNNSGAFHNAFHNAIPVDLGISHSGKQHCPFDASHENVIHTHGSPFPCFTVHPSNYSVDSAAFYRAVSDYNLTSVFDMVDLQTRALRIAPYKERYLPLGLLKAVAEHSDTVTVPVGHRFLRKLDSVYVETNGMVPYKLSEDLYRRQIGSYWEIDKGVFNIVSEFIHEHYPAFYARLSTW